MSVDIDSSTVHTLAEITLAFLLFTDASAVPLTTVRGDLPLTSRRWLRRGRRLHPSAIQSKRWWPSSRRRSFGLLIKIGGVELS